MIFYFLVFQYWLLPFWCLFSETRFHQAWTKMFRWHGAQRIPVKNYTPVAPRRSGGRPKPAWMLETVLELRVACGGSHRRIAAEFNRRHAGSGTTVCPSTVRSWLKRYATEMVEVRKATRNRVPRHMPANRCRGIDATGKADASGQHHFIFGIIDHGSRNNLALIRMAEQTSAALVRQVLMTIEKYGKPRRIKTDNAAVFRSAVFSGRLAAMGIEHVFSAPGKPWQNGRIERLFLTLKQKLNLLIPRDGGELDELLSEFRLWYNEIRPHQHLHGHTPSEAWHGVNPYRCAPRQAVRYVGWGGLLTGWNLRG